MALFRYTARNSSGAFSKGKIEAADEFEAIAELRRNGKTVESIKKTSVKRQINFNFGFGIEPNSLASAASRLAVMLRSGISTGKAVKLAAEGSSDRQIKKILTECSADIEAGLSIAESLEKHRGLIPAAFVETVRAGEESGTLQICFERLSRYYERAHRIRQKLRSAMIYPVLLLALSAIVMGVVMTVLMPVMLGLLENAGGELPLITRALAAVSRFLSAYWPLIAAGILLLAAALRLFSFTDSGRLLISSLRLRLPLIGRAERLSAAGQFAGTFSILASSGLGTSKSIRTAARVLDNRVIGSSLESAAESLESGRSLSEILSENRWLPEMLAEVAAAGEESGSLAESFERAGTYYESEAAAMSDRALRLIEPALTAAVGIFTAVIVIAVYTPMFSMYNGIV